MSALGRPRAELEPTTRRELELRAEQVARLDAELERARAELAAAAAGARREGASLRAIGEATGRHPSTVHELLAGAAA